MNKPGTYVIRKTEQTPDLRYPDWDLVLNSDVPMHRERTRDYLMCDSKEIAAITVNDDLGLVSKGTDLVLSDKPVTCNMDDGIGLVEQRGAVRLSGKDIDRRSNECINITLENYNKLRSGECVSGYKRYDQYAVYNIVSNPSTASIVTYDNSAQECDLIYNSIIGITPHNRETEATFLSTEAPHLSVYDHTHRTSPGGMISFEYMVDTRRMRAIRGYKGSDNKIHAEFGDTFTLIVKDSYGNEMFKKTTYAGLFKINIGPFKEGKKPATGTDNRPLLSGDTWFSIQCIDNHGCGSPVIYLDVLFKAPENPELWYHMTAQDLADYNIVAARRVNGEVLTFDSSAPYSTDDTPYVDDNIVAYRNKRNIQNLMDDHKGATGVVLYNPYADKTDPQNEGKELLYFIDYHKNLGNDNNIDLGSHNYAIYNTEQTIEVVEDDKTVQKAVPVKVADIVQGATIVINGEEYTVDEDPLDWIMHDGAHLYRVGGEGTDKDKIYVKWYGFALDSSTEVTTKDKLKYIRTYNGSSSRNTTSMRVGHIYYVESTIPRSSTKSTGGDWITFPDNFTLDMNSSVWVGSYCEDINDKGRIIRLTDNYNTHVINGTIEGLYGRIDFKRSMLSTSVSTIGETINNLSMGGCRFCSFEGITSKYSLCYDLAIGNTTTMTRVDDPSRMPYPNTLGYIGYDKQIHTPSYIAELSSESSDRYRVNSKSDKANQKVLDGTNTINLVYSSGYASFANTIRSIVFVGLVKDNNHWAKYWPVGKQHEIFVTFYEKDGTPVETVKSHLFYEVRVPRSLAGKEFKVRLSGYGLGKTNLSTGISEISTHFNYNKDSDSYYGTNIAKAFELLGFYERPVKSGRCITIKDCSFINMRSCTCVGCDVPGLTFDHCLWSGIAVEAPSTEKYRTFTMENGNRTLVPVAGRHLTSIAIDFEENPNLRDVITYKNCTMEQGSYVETPTEGDYAGVPITHLGSAAFTINDARNFKLFNTTGFAPNLSAVPSALITDNVFGNYTENRNYKSEKHNVYFRRNISRTGIKVNYLDNSNTSVLDKTSYYYRANRCDDTVDNLQCIIDSLMGIARGMASDNPCNPGRFDWRLVRSKIAGRTSLVWPTNTSWPTMEQD